MRQLPKRLHSTNVFESDNTQQSQQQKQKTIQNKFSSLRPTTNIDTRQNAVCEHCIRILYSVQYVFYNINLNKLILIRLFCSLNT